MVQEGKKLTKLNKGHHREKKKSSSERYVVHLRAQNITAERIKKIQLYEQGRMNSCNHSSEW
jgi:hypothetical protein